MTKEKLIELTSQLNRYDVDDFNHFLTEFFDSNILCIPKGVNRHPDAEILHQYIENCTEDFNLVHFDDALDDWFATDVTSEMRFKVKPSEPVYEWQWLMTPVVNGTNSLTPYMTDNEFKDAARSRGHKYVKLEETKQIRKETK